MLLDLLGEGPAAALVGCFGGLLLGLAARLGRFCTLGAIEDALYGGSLDRARMWGVALGGAIVLTFGAGEVGLADLPGSVYLSTTWSPVAAVGGGLAFGYGMAIAGNCGFGALARLGGGDLRSFVIVLVLGLTAYAVLSGPVAGLRVAMFPQRDATVPQGIAHALADFSAVSPTLPGIAVGFALLAVSAADRAFLTRPAPMLWALAVAVAVASAWIGTTWIARTGFEPVPIIAHTFAAPLGGSMLWVMTASGNGVDFGVGSVAGVLLGAFLGSLLCGQFRWEACEDPRELRRQIAGAALMGAGAVVAFGCSVGQGLSAFSVLAWSAPLTLAAIVCGAALGLRRLIAGTYLV